MGLGPRWSCGPTPLADKNYKLGFSCNRVGQSEPAIDYGVNPNPYDFKVKSATVVNGHTIMLVNYPNCTTYNGDKLLLLRGIWPITMRKLDPHFFEGEHPVIARFEPTLEGSKLAGICARAL